MTRSSLEPARAGRARWMDRGRWMDLGRWRDGDLYTPLQRWVTADAEAATAAPEVTDEVTAR